jgi:hypothetical protein
LTFQSLKGKKKDQERKVFLNSGDCEGPKELKAILDAGDILDSGVVCRTGDTTRSKIRFSGEGRIRKLDSPAKQKPGERR